MRQIICWMLGTEMNKAQFLPLGKVQVSGGGKYTSHCNRCYRDEMRSTGKLKKKFFSPICLSLSKFIALH